MKILFKKSTKLYMIVFLLIILFSCNKNEKNSKKESTIYMGYYPQSRVTNDKLIEQLNKTVGEVPSMEKDNDWSYYNYYGPFSKVFHIYYKDIDLNDDGLYDYRGVYFEDYYNRLNIGGGNYLCQKEYGYFINTIHWFSYDPIKWKILCEEKDEVLIVSDLILDRQLYNDCYGENHNYDEEYNHNGGYGYPDNYDLSSIRIFLNNDFYGRAFNDLEKSKILAKEVDNSNYYKYSYSADYNYTKIEDSIFLLSYDEAENYFETNSKRVSFGTDYAKCLGLVTYSEEYIEHIRRYDNEVYGSSYYLRQSFSSHYPADNAYYAKVSASGEVGSDAFFGSGIRPAIYIKTN